MDEITRLQKALAETERLWRMERENVAMLKIKIEELKQENEHLKKN